MEKSKETQEIYDKYGDIIKQYKKTENYCHTTDYGANLPAVEAVEYAIAWCLDRIKLESKVIPMRGGK